MIIRLFFIAIAAASLAACSSGSQSQANTSGEISDFPIKLNFKTISQLFYCARNDSSGYDSSRLFTQSSASVQWPEQISTIDISPLCDSIIAYVTRRPVASIDSALILFANNPEEAEFYTLHPIDSIAKSYDFDRCYTHSLDISFVSLSRRLAVIKSEQYNYTGGAHGSYASSHMIFSLTDSIARHISFSDIFLPDSDSHLLEAITSALMRKYNVDTLPALDSAGIFTDHLYVSTDISIAGDNIIFHYDPYGIGPWSMGAIDVSIPYYNITDLLTPTGLTLFSD